MWIYLALLIPPLIYWWLSNHYNYWKTRGVPGPKPRFFVGNLGESVISRSNPLKAYSKIYDNYKDSSIIGVFQFWHPCLLVKDPELIKNIVVKDFKHFVDNHLTVNEKQDPILARNPFILKGEEWKNLRASISPGFSSSKMKTSFESLKKNGQKLADYVGKHPSPLEAKDLCAKFTIENVSICAFGLEANCFDNPEAEFRKLANQFLSPEGIGGFIMMLTFVLPNLLYYLPIGIVPKDVQHRLIDIIKQTIEYRESNKVVRNDYIQTLIDLKNKENWSLEEVVAQCATFFGDGYETSSIVLSFVLFNLAQNEEVQNKLRNELETVASESPDQSLTYENIAQCQYLEACIWESMRCVPILDVLIKSCTEQYTLTTVENAKPLSVTLTPGDTIIIPVASLHTDSKYFENPDKFIPERFEGENKNKITKFTYLPFGEGPRACIGQRFGMLQIKVGVAALVRNYKITVNQKTQLPLTFDPLYPMPSPKGGLWLDFEQIKS